MSKQRKQGIPHHFVSLTPSRFQGAPPLQKYEQTLELLGVFNAHVVVLDGKMYSVNQVQCQITDGKVEYVNVVLLPVPGDIKLMAYDSQKAIDDVTFN